MYLFINLCALNICLSLHFIVYTFHWCTVYASIILFLVCIYVLLMVSGVTTDVHASDGEVVKYIDVHASFVEEVRWCTCKLLDEEVHWCTCMFWVKKYIDVHVSCWWRSTLMYMWVVGEEVHWCTCKFCWWRSTLMYRQVVGEEVHQCPCKFCWQRIKLMYMQAVMKKYTDVQASCGEEAHWCTCGLWWRNRTSFLSWVCVPKADVTRFRVKLGRTDVNKNSFFPRTVRD